MRHGKRFLSDRRPLRCRDSSLLAHGCQHCKFRHLHWRLRNSAPVGQAFSPTVPGVRKEAQPQPESSGDEFLSLSRTPAGADIRCRTAGDPAAGRGRGDFWYHPGIHSPIRSLRLWATKVLRIPTRPRSKRAPRRRQRRSRSSELLCRVTSATHCSPFGVFFSSRMSIRIRLESLRAT